MSLLAMIKGRRGPSGFGYASTAQEVTEGLDLHGKTILVTGINSGIGQESARVLALRGARILGAARTRDKAREACAALQGDPVPLECELSEPASVRACVREAAAHGPLDVILCNAGIMALSQRTVLHGQELQFLTNHIGHFILVTGLLPQLREDGRVVMLSSDAHRRTPPGGIAFDDLTLASGYRPWTAYVLLPTIVHGDRGLKPRTTWGGVLVSERTSDVKRRGQEEAEVHGPRACGDPAGCGAAGRRGGSESTRCSPDHGQQLAQPRHAA